MRHPFFTPTVNNENWMFGWPLALSTTECIHSRQTLEVTLLVNAPLAAPQCGHPMGPALVGQPQQTMN
jgi:hypothetical protein